MAVFSETISLKDEVSGSAKKAAQEVEVLSKGLESVQKSLIKAQALGDVKAVGKLTKQTEAYEAALSVLPPAESGAAEGASVLGMELAAVTAVAAAVVAAIGAVAVALGAVIIKGALFAIESNQAKQAMLGMFDAMGQGKTTGAEVDDMLSGLADRIGITKDELVPLTKSFMSMGVTGVDALEKLTTAALSAQAIMGDPAAGQAFTELTKKISLASQTGQGLKIPLKGLGSLADMGLTVDDVARKMGISAKVLGEQLKSGAADAGKFGEALSDALIEKGAGPLKRLGSSMDNIKKKFLQDFGDMFEDIDVGPFMEEVKSLFGIFAAATPSGQALKAGIGGFFKEVFALATRVVPLVKHFMLDLVILGLKAYIAIKPIAKAIAEWAVAASQNETVIAVVGTIIEGFKMLGMVLAVAIGIVLLLVGAVAAIVTVFTLAGIAIIGFASEAGTALGGWISSAATAAYDFVAGLVQGITNGAGMVMSAVSGLADSATGAFKSALGIASPSKVMMELGGYTGEGFAVGLDDSAVDVHGAASGVAGAAVAGATEAPASTAAGGAAAAGGGVNVQVFIEGAGKGIMELSREAMAAAFEAAALGMGV